MKIDDPQIPLERMQAFTDAGHWTETTSNERLQAAAETEPDKIALVDPRVRLSYAAYYGRAQRLAARLERLGLTSEDVVAIQLPNWSEFAVAINAAMLVGVPLLSVPQRIPQPRGGVHPGLHGCDGAHRAARVSWLRLPRDD